MVDWRPTAARRVLETRAAFIARIRDFFSAHAALEVETPMLAASAPTDPFIHSLATTVTGSGRRWLHTSPEFPMKRLLAAGIGDCWQLCRVFRDGEAGRLHNPEFTLLEWYRVGWDDARLMDEVDALVHAVCAGHRDFAPTERVPYATAFERATGVAFAAADPRACARLVPTDSALTTAEWHDLVWSTRVVPKLGRRGPCFVTDYPAEQAALARLRGPVAARFELVIDGIELANGYHELKDADEQRARFDADNALRRSAGRAASPTDERLLAALAAGLPDCAGVALGFDRLVMVALGVTDIAEVLAFPFERA